MNRHRLGTSDEGRGPIYGPQCFLARILHLVPELDLTVEVFRIKVEDFLRHPIAVGEEE